MALSFIGKPISLISHSDVRYRGILAGIDPAASTIQLSNVYSMGTESRRPAEQFIPPVQEPYAYIIFRASEVKDLAVDEPQPRRSVHDDPAVIGVSAPVAPGNYPYGSPGYQQQPGGVPPPQAPSSVSPHQPRQQAYPQGEPAPPNAHVQQQSPAPNQNGATSPAGQPGSAKTPQSSAIRAATVSMESVERALDDLRVAGQDATTSAPHHGGRGGRRGGNRHDQKAAADLKVPATDFDFQSANARFDKFALGPTNRPTPQAEASPVVEGEGDGADGENKDKKDKLSAYNPKASFFDSLSSGSNAPTPSEGGRGGGRGGRRGGGGRNRREEERERNVATFGEPGGIGLMGPGAYVGGWGGYGRRGGSRGGRRGGGGHGSNSRQ